MSEEEQGWDGDDIVQKIPVFGALRTHFTAYTHEYGSRKQDVNELVDGQILSEDKITQQMVAQFGEQFDLIGDFHELLGTAIGVQGDTLGDVNKVQTLGEDTNTQNANWTGGGKH